MRGLFSNQIYTITTSTWNSKFYTQLDLHEANKKLQAVGAQNAKAGDDSAQARRQIQEEFKKLEDARKQFDEQRRTVENKRKDIEEREKALAELDRQLKKRKEQMDQMEASLRKVRKILIFVAMICSILT